MEFRFFTIENVGDRGELEVVDELLQARFALVQVVVVAEPGEPLDIEPWLARVDLPGMQVKDEGLALSVGLAQAPLAEGVGVEPEVTAAGDGQGEAGKFQSRQGEFDQFMTLVRGQAVGASVDCPACRSDRGGPGIWTNPR